MNTENTTNNGLDPEQRRTLRKFAGRQHHLIYEPNKGDDKDVFRFTVSLIGAGDEVLWTENVTRDGWHEVERILEKRALIATPK